MAGHGTLEGGLGGTNSPPGLRLRPEVEADAGFLFELYTESRRDDPGVRALPERDRRTFLDLQFRAREQFYRDRFGSADRLVLTGSGADHPAGRLVVHPGDGQALLVVDIAVSLTRRGQGLGRAMLERVMDSAAEQQLAVRLKVEHTNPAKGFYRRLGFVESSADDVHATMEWMPAGITGTATPDG